MHGRRARDVRVHVLGQRDVLGLLLGSFCSPRRRYV